jgi:predicted nuclease with TOPRIM domain
LRLAKFKGLELDPSKISESTTVETQIHSDNRLLFSESTDTVPRILLPRIEAIHAGRTRNYNRYLVDKLQGDVSLKSGVYSWLHPFAKPVIYNHDTSTEATGRIYNAAFTQHTRAGRPGIVVIPKITDSVAIQKILDGRLLTVSIGATTDSAVCSVCGTDIIEEGWCGHEKGQVYEDVLCEWIAGNLFFDELSWVNVPADSDAMVIDSIGIAEAFADSGSGIINLGKKQTEWVLTRELAIAEGLLPAEEKEGESILKTVEELQAEVDQLTSNLEQVTTEKSDLEAQLGTANSTLETARTDLATKTTELADVQAMLETKTTEVEEATTAKATAEAEVTTLTQTVEGFETERTTLMEANTKLAAENHKSLAERVVDLKAVLGKVEKREEALDSHVARSTESLKDTLADLLVESVSFTPTRVKESLNNPASGTATGKEANSIIEGKDDNAEELTAEVVLAKLFGSRTNNKNQ